MQYKVPLYSRGFKRHISMKTWTKTWVTLGELQVERNNGWSHQITLWWRILGTMGQGLKKWGNRKGQNGVYKRIFLDSDNKVTINPAFGRSFCENNMATKNEMLGGKKKRAVV